MKTPLKVFNMKFKKMKETSSERKKFCFKIYIDYTKLNWINKSILTGVTISHGNYCYIYQKKGMYTLQI